MAKNLVTLENGYYPFFNKGRAIFNGFIFVGEPDTDPTIVGNQKVVTALQEDNTEVPIAQPIRTGAGGVPILDGSPVQLTVDGDYALLVQDSGMSQIYYNPRRAAGTPLTAADAITSKNTIADMVGDLTLVLGQSVSVNDYATGNNSGILFGVVVAGGTGTDDGGSFIDLDNGLQWKQLFKSNSVNVKQFGAVGDGVVDDSDAMLAAKEYLVSKGGGEYIVPKSSGAYTTSKTINFSVGNIAVELYADIKKTNTTLGSTNPLDPPETVNGSALSFYSGSDGTMTPYENYLRNISVTGHGMPKIDGGGDIITGFSYSNDGLLANALQFNYCAEVSVSGLFVRNGLYNSAAFKFCSNVFVDACIFIDSVHENGLSINQDTSWYAEDDDSTKANAVVTNCIAFDNEDYGMSSFNASNSHFTNCLSRDNVIGGFSSEASGSAGSRKINVQNKYENCSALRNAIAGWLITTNETMLNNCEAMGTTINVSADPGGVSANDGNGIKAFDVLYLEINGGRFHDNTNKGIYVFQNHTSQAGTVIINGAEVHDNGFQNITIREAVTILSMQGTKAYNLAADSGYFDDSLFLQRTTNPKTGGEINIGNSYIQGTSTVDGFRRVSISDTDFHNGRAVFENILDLELYNNTGRFDPSIVDTGASNQAFSIASTTNNLYLDGNKSEGDFSGFSINAAVQVFGLDRDNYYNRPGTQQIMNKQSENNDATPTVGTYEKGAVIWNTAPASAQPMGWVCTVAGTVDAIGPSLTGTGTSGSRLLTIGGGALRGELFEGQYIKMAGEALRQIERIMDNDGTGDQVYLTANLSSSPAAVAITRVAATFIPLANIP